MVTIDEERILDIRPSERVLLLSHCLRRTETCQGRYTSQGLQCRECNPDCPVNQLRQAALGFGYRGVCIAPGGQLAIKYVAETKPLAIVAIACEKELREGIQGVSELAGDNSPIPIVAVPLSKDGCVDTEVDVELALEKIALGCTIPVESH